MFTCKKFLFSFVLVSTMSLFNTANATIFFSLDGEDCNDGDPAPKLVPYADGRTEERRAYCVADPTAPQGNNVIQWHATYDNEHDQYNESDFDSYPSSNAGKTYYLAFYFRFDRINGVDIWPEGAPDTESFDKAVELRGNGLRWIIDFGERGMGNQDHHFSAFITDITYQHNPQLEVWDSYYQNHNGYDRYNSIQLEYEKWHSLVFEMVWATGNTGRIGMWVNGIKVLEYNNVITVDAPGNLNSMGWMGTYAQPSYTVKQHYRKFDAVIVTDDWQDVIDGGYMSKLPKPPLVQ